MIVDVYFNTFFRPTWTGGSDPAYARSNKIITDGNEIRVKALKEMPDEARLIFILNTTQKVLFDKMVKDYELKDLIQFVFDRPITNRIHKDSGRRVYLVVMAKTPLTEEEYGNTIKKTEACVA